MIKVYKIGGGAIEDDNLRDAFCRDFAAATGPRILVHGGGVLASDLQKKLGQTPVKIEGRRVTDAETLKVVTMAYAGWCSKMIVATLQKYGCNAIGMAGCDGSVITAAKRAPRLLLDGVTEVDYGFVGDVTPSSVNAALLEKFCEMGLTPVMCAINHDGDGQLLNTNADTVASSVAAAVGGELVCCFELNGVLRDINDKSSVIPVVTSEDFQRMKADGSISEGMIPKIENCLDALRRGAKRATIKNASAINGELGTEIQL